MNKQPEEPGYFWFRETAGDWQILKVKRRGETLIYITDKKTGIPVASLQGEWGGRIQEPGSSGSARELAEKIADHLFTDHNRDPVFRLVQSKEGEDRGRSGWGRNPVIDFIERELRGAVTNGREQTVNAESESLPR